MHFHPVACLLSASLMLVACSSGKEESPDRGGTPSAGSAVPSISVPGVLPGSGSRTEFKQPLPGNVVPSFEYSIVTDMDLKQGPRMMRHVSLDTPLDAREAVERLLAQFMQAGLEVALPVEENRNRKGELIGYHAGAQFPGENMLEGRHVGIMASDRKDEPASVILTISRPADGGN